MHGRNSPSWQFQEFGRWDFLLFSLYKAGKDSKDLELAKESLNFLEQEINAEKTSVDIYNPKGWVILSWPYQNEGKLPRSCSNLGWDGCVCIVKDVSLGSQLWSTLPFTGNVREKFLENSDDNGICMENSKQLTVRKDGIQQQPIPIEPPLNLKIDYQNKMISKA